MEMYPPTNGKEVVRYDTAITLKLLSHTILRNPCNLAAFKSKLDSHARVLYQRRSGSD
jgi:hypothetical protein